MAKTAIDPYRTKCIACMQRLPYNIVTLISSVISQRLTLNDHNCQISPRMSYSILVVDGRRGRSQCSWSGCACRRALEYNLLRAMAITKTTRGRLHVLALSNGRTAEKTDLDPILALSSSLMQSWISTRWFAKYCCSRNICTKRPWPRHGES